MSLPIRETEQQHKCFHQTHSWQTLPYARSVHEKGIYYTFPVIFQHYSVKAGYNLGDVK